MGQPRTVALYLRVSTDDQTVENQRRDLEAAVERRGWRVVAEFCERVIVMYTGRIVEEAPVRDLFANPAHPYTRGLLKSLPSLAGSGTAKRLQTIAGMVPPIDALPPGCKFNPRCPDVMPICLGKEPARMLVGARHDARCYLHGDQADPERT